MMAFRNYNHCSLGAIVVVVPNKINDKIARSAEKNIRVKRRHHGD